jgi:hypothetical protein
MTKKIKHLLPASSILEHCSMDQNTLNELIQCIAQLQSEFKTPIEVNKKLCSVHNELTHTSYKNFYQISLTDTSADNEEVTFEELDKINEQLSAGSMVDSYRRKQKLSTEENNPMNETTFTVKTETYKRYESLFNKVLGQFRGTPTRIRLVKLEAGASITPHIDYDPSYSVRVIIPIMAEPECVNLFWVKNKVEAINFAPGNAYFLNTGYKHAVINYSDKDRYTFMISLKDTKDIDHLLHDNLQIP